MREMEPVLRVENLTKIYKRRGQPELTAVRRISFTVNPGECLGLIGESGSGKSTAAEMIARLLEVSEGSLYLEGREYTHAGGAELRKIYTRMQMVFQMPADSFDPRRTLGDGIGESLRNNGWKRGDAKRETARLLEMCGLPSEYADRYPHEVSIGECQRAAIARAIAVKPGLLICDEATSALDVTVQQEILALLGGLRRTFGLSILFICHDIAVVQQFCDRMIVLNQGEIVEEGIPDAVIQNPKDPYTKRLIDSIL